MGERLSIGEMAELNNISRQTLHFYDRIGLLKPYYVDEETGYRYYNVKQCAMLDMIQYMKALGMSLKEIKNQLNHYEIGLVQDMLQNQKFLIKEKICGLIQMQNALERATENYKRYESSPRDGSIVIEYINPRRIYCYDSKINIYDYGLATYEYILRELKSHLLSYNLPMVYFCNVGSILRMENLKNGKLISTEIFLFVDEDFQTNKGIEIIPSNTYACIYCDSFHKEKDYANMLLKHIKEKGYEIVGDYICEVVAELPVFPQDERNMFIKLQIPIKF